MRVYSATDVGQKREVNQDYIFCSEQPVGNLSNLLIVADGMGGHNAGDFASRFCVEEVVSGIRNHQEATIIATIESAIIQANSKLIQQSLTKSDLEGMGTTLVLATVTEHMMYVANVGDSRLYLINDVIRQITEDHSLVEEMIRSGEIKREEARFHPKKNIITRAIGVNRKVSTDFFEVGLSKGDKILLCSDGLSNMISDQEILAIIKENHDDYDSAVKELMKHANESGGKDNISIILAVIDE